MDKVMLRRIGSFGANWASLIFIFLLIFLGDKKLIPFLDPDYHFSRFWDWDIAGILMLFTCLVGFFISKRITGTKEALYKIWNFGAAWILLIFIFNVIFFGAREFILRWEPNYTHTFSRFWNWDIVGIVILATCLISFVLTRQSHAKK